MLSVSAFQLNALLAAFLLPFVRILAFLGTDPVLGNGAMPGRVKIGLALALTVVVAPLLPPPAVDPGSAEGLFVLAEQIVVGLSMGFALRLVFDAISFAAEVIGLQMGLGFATFFDPQHAQPSSVVGSFLSLLAVLAYLSLNVHLWVIQALVDSFRTLPVAPLLLRPDGFVALARYGATMLVFALKVALPVVAAMLIVNLALGIATRAAPQLNLFSVGFPLTLAAGFAVLAALLPLLAPLFERLFADGLGLIGAVARLLAPAPG